MTTTETNMINILSNMLVSSLKSLEEKNPALVHKVSELYAKTTKWERELTYNELVLFHQFIEDNINETDPAKFRYGQEK